MGDKSFRTERDILREIIALYRDSPCLWDTSNDLYRDKDARSEAISLLVDKWKTIAKDADTEFVKKKLENMRTTYIRERRKVEAKEYAGIQYKPLLWYYEDMTFLTELPKRSRVSSTEDDDANDKHASRNIATRDHIYSTPIQGSVLETLLTRSDLAVKNTSRLTSKKSGSGSTNERRKSKRQSLRVRQIPKKRLKYTDTEEHFMSAEPDSTDYTALAMSHQLKEMTRVQRCIAEKLIADVIFYGKLEQLTVNSSVNVDSNNTPSQHIVVVQDATSREEVSPIKNHKYEEYLEPEISE